MSVPTATAESSHPNRACSSPVLAAMRVAGLMAASLFLLACWAVLRKITRDIKIQNRRAAHWTSRWTRWCLAMTGFRVTTSGPNPAEGSLVAPNHIGYADVLALGSVVPCFFVAKVDVESWPFVGLLFRISKNIGVPRRRARALVEVTSEVAERLRGGNSVCVFLEGTSTGGDRLLPFYPPLAQPAIDAQAPTVPVAIRWRADSPDIDVAEDVAYWKDHVFGPHAWRLMGLRGISVHIQFGDPIPAEGHNRKTLAAAAESAVAAMTGLPVLGPEARPESLTGKADRDTQSVTG